MSGLDLNFGNNTPQQGKTSLNLSKGMSLDLAKHSNLKNVRLGLGWQAGQGNTYDLDASALLLNGRGLVNDNRDVIFYNQPDTGRGVRSLGDNRVGSTGNMGGQTDDETIIVSLDKVPMNVDSIKFIVTIDKAFERNQNFGAVRNAYIRVIDDDTDEELGIYKLAEEFNLQTACEIAELRRRPTGWEFTPIGRGTVENLETVLIRHGVQ